MRLIDADVIPALFDEEFKETRKLIQQGETHLDNLAEGFTEAARVIRKMPTIDAVSVVRCKDCIHCYEQFGLLFCTCGPNVDCVVPPEFYCADGKRKRRARGVE